MGEVREQLENFDEREVDRIEAIIKSMTPQERRQPRILNGSRRLRVAKGSGVQVSDVNQLIDRFSEAQKVMRQMRRGGGMPGMPGLPGMPGAGGKKGRGKSAPPPRKGKAKSGNPAKRAQQEREVGQRGSASSAAPGGAFGLGAGSKPTVDPSSVNLPAGFEKFLGK
jgi:signal recognition particle subunit SRP54